MCPCVVMLYNDAVFFCRKRTFPTYYSVYMFNLLAINVCSGDPSMLQKLLMDDTFIYHYKKRGGALDSAVGTRFSCSDCHFLFLFLSICKSNFRHQWKCDAYVKFWHSWIEDCSDGDTLGYAFKPNSHFTNIRI